jgi:DNA polymerase-3 subunit epsilon
MQDPALDLLRSLVFCVVDLETTGGSADKDEMFEVGLVRIEDLRVTEERSFRLNPGRDIPDFVQRLTGIKQADVVGCPTFSDVADEIRQFAGDAILVAHNTSFDIPFLNAKLLQAGRPVLENKVLCTNVMTKYMIPEIVNSNLEYMGKIFDLGEMKAHRAVEDARLTARLLLKYLEIFRDKGIRKANQLYYPRNRFELDRVHLDARDGGAEKLQALLAKEDRPVLVTAKGENGVIVAVLPVQNPAQESSDVLRLMAAVPWTMVTVKLIGPFMEGLLAFNAHYLKMPEAHRLSALEYLRARVPAFQVGGANPLEEKDFLVMPHLIQGQLLAYSLMGLTPFTQLIFKFPAHRKKVSQFLMGQVGRFESQKGPRRHQLLPEVRPLVEGWLQERVRSADPTALFLARTVFKKDPKNFFGPVETMVKSLPDPFQFPARHL